MIEIDLGKSHATSSERRWSVRAFLRFLLIGAGVSVFHGYEWCVSGNLGSNSWQGDHRQWFIEMFFWHGVCVFVCVCACVHLLCVCVKVLPFWVCRCTNTHALVLISHPRSTRAFRDVHFAKIQSCVCALWSKCMQIQGHCQISGVMDRPLNKICESLFY